MDFRGVTGLTIPAGSVNKISIDGVIYWNKEISDDSWLMLGFDRDGRYIQLIGNTGKYFPACVIG